MKRHGIKPGVRRFVYFVVSSTGTDLVKELEDSRGVGWDERTGVMIEGTVLGKVSEPRV